MEITSYGVQNVVVVWPLFPSLLLTLNKSNFQNWPSITVFYGDINNCDQNRFGCFANRAMFKNSHDILVNWLDWLFDDY